MNWRFVDLNLLFIFDAVARERSITDAARCLHISQSAVSHALARLRRALRDELFLRRAAGMEPTTYASTLIEPVRTTLSVIQDALSLNSAFNPNASGPTFRVAVDNCSAVTLAPRLVAAVAAQAPGVTLDLRAGSALDIPKQLELGTMDLAIGNIADPRSSLMDEFLFEDGFVALARRTHPVVSEVELTIEALSTVPFLCLSSTSETDRFIDTELDQRRLARHVAIRAPLLSATALLTQSDMIAVVSERTARAFVTETPCLAVLDLPFATPRRRTAMLWHRRTDDLPSHRWLRDLVRTIADGDGGRGNASACVR